VDKAGRLVIPKELHDRIGPALRAKPVIVGVWWHGRVCQPLRRRRALARSSCVALRIVAIRGGLCWPREDAIDLQQVTVCWILQTWDERD